MSFKSSLAFILVSLVVGGCVNDAPSDGQSAAVAGPEDCELFAADPLIATDEDLIACALDHEFGSCFAVPSHDECVPGIAIVNDAGALWVACAAAEQEFTEDLFAGLGCDNATPETRAACLLRYVLSNRLCGAVAPVLTPPSPTLDCVAALADPNAASDVDLFQCALNGELGTCVMSDARSECATDFELFSQSLDGSSRGVNCIVPFDAPAADPKCITGTDEEIGACYIRALLASEECG